LIKFHSGKPYLNGRVDPGGVDRLLDAINSPAISAPEAKNLRITADWLRKNSDPLDLTGFPNQRALFERKFSDQIEAVIPALFRFDESDDYRNVDVTVLIAGGEQWSASSTSYYEFMLPWTIEVHGHRIRTYNADVSRGIAALMPHKTTNRELLNGTELKEDLTAEVMRNIRTEWDELGVDYQAPGILSSLRREFEVERPRIDANRGVDFGLSDVRQAHHEENLQAVLQRRGTPSNLGDDVVLLFHDGQVDGVAD
jgi:hypothetical protein